jgi:O-antigen/teichoic acid export membrane protein
MSQSKAKINLQRILVFSKLVSITSISLIIIQAISFVCGILIIRKLTTNEYAYYTLANTMAATMGMLSDAGISNGVTAQGGQAWNNKTKLGSIIVTGMKIRKKFSVYCVIILLPILFTILMQHGASYLSAFFISLSILPMFLTELSGKIFAIVPLLRQDLQPLQLINIANAIARLFSLCLFIFAFPFATVAILTAGFTQLWRNHKLKKLSQKYADLSQPVDPVVHHEMIKVVKKIFPGALYYCFSGQLNIWIISAFGTTQSLAQFGAISRLTIVYTLMSTLFVTIITPRFARLPNIRKSLILFFLLSQICLYIIVGGITTLTYLFPQEILSIFGDQYKDLTNEVILIVIGGGLNVISASIWSINSSRSFLPPWYFDPALGILSTVAFSFIFNLSEIIGVLYLNISLALITIMSFNIIFFIFTAKIKNEKIMASE